MYTYVYNTHMCIYRNAYMYTCTCILFFPKPVEASSSHDGGYRSRGPGVRLRRPDLQGELLSPSMRASIVIVVIVITMISNSIVIFVTISILNISASNIIHCHIGCYCYLWP